jgi:hypothetical protein
MSKFVAVRADHDLLYNHSRRVLFWGALTGERRGLKYDPKLFYLSAMIHDMRLTELYSSADLRFGVDGANAAPDFMKRCRVPDRTSREFGPHCTAHPARIPEHMRPTIALLTAGVEMDCSGLLMATSRASSGPMPASIISPPSTLRIIY